MYKNHPEMAKRWESETPKDKKLPEKVAKPIKQVKLKKIGKV
jgi:hypothetical protein